MELVRTILDSPWFLGAWALSAVVALVWLWTDLRRNNRHLGGMMKLVWTLTVAYSGLIGLAVYFISGRKEIPADTLWRRACRSDAHCYSGCGMGEIIGVVLSVGLFAMGLWEAALITFSLAYIFGVALTVGPLMQEGNPFGTALKDAVISETASIVFMEAVAIAVDFYLGEGARMGDVRFWSSLAVSLSLGFFAALPVNALLIRLGIKEGMHDPRMGAPAA
jgi:uncharacterized membrane protein